VRTFARALLVLAIASTIGCAQKDWIDRTLLTEDVTGTWTGSAGGRAVVRLELKHQGPKVTGTVGWLGGTSESIEGSLAGDVFTFKSARGTVSGILTVSGDEMTGQMSGWPLGGNQTRQVSMRRDGTSPPSSSPLR